MNAIHQGTAGGDDERLLDMLVDGELSEADRRELLTRLDRSPEGWRRCALAFLEAQSWKKELKAAVPPASPQPPAVRPGRRTDWVHRTVHLAALAAGLLVAVWLGTQLRQPLSGPGGDQPGPESIADTHGAAATNGAVHPRPLPRQPGGDSAAEPWEMVTLTSANGPGGQPESIELPAVKRDRIDEAWLNGRPDAMPPELLNALKRSGHQVQQRRELVPVQMQDGRQLVVPVDQVEIHYVGRPAL